MSHKPAWKLSSIQSFQTNAHISNWLNATQGATVAIQAKISKDELQPKMILSFEKIIPQPNVHCQNTSYNNV